MPSLAQFEQVNRDFRTPKRLKLQTLLSVDLETLPMPLVVPRRLSEFVAPKNDKAAQKLGIETILDEWEQVSINFETLFGEFNKLSEGEKKYREALTTTIGNLQSGV